MGASPSSRLDRKPPRRNEFAPRSPCSPLSLLPAPAAALPLPAGHRQASLVHGGMSTGIATLTRTLSGERKGLVDVAMIEGIFDQVPELVFFIKDPAGRGYTSFRL